MDLTHEEFLHTSSIGGDNISSSDFVVTHDDDGVTADPMDDRRAAGSLHEGADAQPVPWFRG